MRCPAAIVSFRRRAGAPVQKSNAWSASDRNKQNRKRQRAERRAAGLCTRCGQSVEDKDYARCRICRKKETDRIIRPQSNSPAQKKSRIARADRYRNAGLCPRCGRTPQEGKNWCAKCLGVARQSSKRARRKKKLRAAGLSEKQIEFIMKRGK